MKSVDDGVDIDKYERLSQKYEPEREVRDQPRGLDIGTVNFTQILPIKISQMSHSDYREIFLRHERKKKK